MTSEVLYLLDVETGFKQLREIGVAEQVRMDVKVKHHRYIAVALPEFVRHLEKRMRRYAQGAADYR